ncbi:MAG: GFA family protein [Xanthobacteraceae bacterium]
MRIDGSCHCGFIAIEGEADPEKVQICHCTDCQTGTGSAFRISIPVPGASFKMTGQPITYLKTTADSGRPRVQAFCGKCGSPIYSTTEGDGVQPSYTVRVGILRQRDQLAPRRQQWFRSARPWVTELASVPKNEKQS